MGLGWDDEEEVTGLGRLVGLRRQRFFGRLTDGGFENWENGKIRSK
jgi:hypothetical protein